MPISVSGTTITFNDATTQTTAAVPGGNYVMTTFTSSGTWTKPSGLKSVKVTVIGAGGNGGNAQPSANKGRHGGGGGGAIKYISAPAIPGPVTVTVGTAPSKTSSYGPFVSATGGSNGTPNTGPFGTTAGGSGSGGDINVSGGPGIGSQSGTIPGAPEGGSSYPGISGAGAFAFGGFGIAGIVNSAGSGAAGTNGVAYGGGATGGVTANAAPDNRPGGTGAAGIVIVEEFY
jgi:hypothetical protein